MFLLDVPSGVSGDYLYVNRSVYPVPSGQGLLVIKESVSNPYPITINSVPSKELAPLK